MSSSGKGQSRITNASEVAGAWEYAASGGRVNQGVVIVEGQIDFDYEITLLTIRAKNANGEIETSFCAPIGHLQKRGDYVESWQPQAMTANALKESQRIAKAVTDNLGGLGLFGVELFVKGDQVWFSEVSPRPHDTGMVTMATQRFNEFELHARAILGLPVTAEMRAPGASAVIYGGVDSKNLSFEGVEIVIGQFQIDHPEKLPLGEGDLYPEEWEEFLTKHGEEYDKLDQYVKKFNWVNKWIDVDKYFKDKSWK
jgi:phosphoribosylglycinamide formyltransferase 2